MTAHPMMWCKQNYLPRPTKPWQSCKEVSTFLPTLGGCIYYKSARLCICTRVRGNKAKVVILILRIIRTSKWNELLPSGWYPSHNPNYLGLVGLGRWLCGSARPVRSLVLLSLFIPCTWVHNSLSTALVVITTSTCCNNYKSHVHGRVMEKQPTATRARLVVITCVLLKQSSCET